MRVPEVHELKKRGGVDIFSDDKDLCLSAGYLKRLPKGELRMVEHGGMREVTLCELATPTKRTYFWADIITGTLYRASDGKCMSSNKLRLVIEDF